MLKKNKIHLLFSLIIFSMICVFVYVNFFSNKIEKKSFVYDLIGLKSEYAQAYTLVNDKISQDANIEINLPEGVLKEDVKDTVLIYPKIDGKWQAVDDERKIVFVPKEKMELGKYYSVSLQTKKGTISKDFLVEENPKILNIFPKANSETHEKSNITIIFNRPMVPLTVLDVLAEIDLPIEIEPKTKGKFKWISTKSLQFIPDKSLIASANYQVKIKKGFKSLDGLEISPFEHNFKTRNLRYENFSLDEKEKVYNQAISLRFNQAIDLEKTKKEISLQNLNEKKNIEFVAEYGIKKIYNQQTKKYEEQKNYAVINIFNKKDQHGRNKVWDFKNSYQLKIKKAYPEFGDIVLEQPKVVNINVSDVLQKVSAESERSNFSSQDFFDPKGKLILDFWEEVDLEKSKIFAEKLIKIEYGEKCLEKDDEGYYSNNIDCEKIPDKTKLYFVFDYEKISYEEELKIKLEKIVNLAGQQINFDVIDVKIKSIPKLKIIKTVPESLTDFYICTNSPLEKPDKEDVYQYLKVKPEYEFKGWNSSFLIPKRHSSYYKCAVGEFQTNISYGLMPETNYQVNLSLVDHFGEKDEKEVRFKTGKMPEYFLNFYHFQKRNNVTTSDKTKLTYAGENMDFVEMNICKLDAVDMLYYLEFDPHYTKGPEVIKDCIENKNVRIDLKKKYWIKNYFQVDLADYIEKPFGHYILTFSHPNYKEHYGKNRKVYERTFLSVTNLAVTEKKINIGEITSQEQEDKINNFYWVVDSKNLQAIKNAQVDVYNRNYNDKKDEIIKINSFETDFRGVAQSFASTSLIGVIVTDKKNNDSAILSNNYDKLKTGSTAYSYKKIYTYTDRPIYRPGQTVHIKGLYRIGFDGDYEIFQDKKIKVSIYSGARNVVLEKEVEVNDFGTFNLDYEIENDADLGKYRVQTDYGISYFDVEEYVPAAFQVEVKNKQEEYIAGESFQVDVDASYYFGAPLEGGEIEYSVASQDYYFDKYTDEYFSFGRSWYSCYWDCSYNDKFILRNKTSIDKNGKASIRHDLDFEKLFKDEQYLKSKIFTVYMNVQNENGQSISAQKSFIVHAGDFYIGLNLDKRFLGKNENFEIKAKSVDTEGEKLKVENIDLSINKILWVRNKRKEVDGSFYYKWEEKLEKIKSEKFSTNRSGDWKKEFSLNQEGSFRIIVEAINENGNTISNSYDFYVYGDAKADVRPRNDDVLEIEASQKELNVGENAEIIIKSPYDKAKALIAIERGKIFDYKIVDIKQSLYKYDFTIQEDYLPNVFVSVTLLSPKPEIKYGNVRFYINRDEKKLDISVKANKDFYLPGEEVVLDVEVLNNAGSPEQAELSIAVADLSVLALKGNPKKNPLVFFYNGFPLTVTTASNIKNILYEVDVPTGTKGGGGSEAEDLAKKKRGEFKDTAFWQANLKTDANGKAQVKFDLPDNLTTWQVESLGISKDSKLGVDYQEFVSQKELMIVPLQPRFVLPGDEFMIGAKVFNQSGKKQKIVIKFNSSSLDLDDKNIKEIKIKSNESQIVYFKIKAPLVKNKGYHDFVISAATKYLEDTVEKTIKINRNTTYENTATAGYSSKNQVNEYVFLPDDVVVDQGELTIKTSATLAVFLSDALNYLLDYPYGNSESLASKLEAIAIVKKGLNLENIGDKFEIDEINVDGEIYTMDDLVEIALKKLYKNQKNNGGFAYYPNSKNANMYLSLHVANAFVDLRESGYQVEDKVYDKLFSYINDIFQVKGNFSVYNNENDTSIAIAYILNKMDKDINQVLKNKIRSLVFDQKYIQENINNISLINLILLSMDNPNLFNKKFQQNLFDNLENRIEIDSRGAFLPISKNYNWENYETSIKDTALLLKTLVKNKSDNEILDRILRWLLNARSKDGAWGSTSNTIYVMDAMIDYLIWQEENKSDFNLKVVLNNQEKKSFDYSPHNIFEQNSFEMILNELGFGDLNTISFKKTNNNDLKNNFYYDLALKYYLPANAIPPRDEGFAINRNFYTLEDKELSNPVKTAKVGDVLKGKLKINLAKDRNLVLIEDFIPAGFELVNFDLDTENKRSIQNQDDSRGQDEMNWYFNWQNNRKIYPDKLEIRDDRLMMFKERLSQGEYEYEYYVRALVPGKFQHLPARINEIYFPENFGRTCGGYFVVQE